MKQNERFLVYAVTGFLALILVIAIVFGDTPTTPEQSRATGGTSLNDILNGAGKTPKAEAGEAEQVVSVTGISGPAATKVEQPLRIKAPSAEAQVMQKIGPYTLEHGFRRVEVKPNDSWHKIATRWCLDVDFVDEIKCCNESTTDLRAGQKLFVPMVASDEQLLARLEAEAKPTLLVAGQGAATVAGQPTGQPSPASASQPNFATPRIERGAPDAAAAIPAAPLGDVAVVTPAQVRFEVYTVKPGDMLEPILRKRFGDKHFRARKSVEQLNPGLDADSLKIGQQIKLPLSAE